MRTTTIKKLKESIYAQLRVASLAMLIDEPDTLSAISKGIKASLTEEQMLTNVKVTSMPAVMKVVDAARRFCETTMSEYESVKDSQSAALPAEFVLLHEAVQGLHE